MEGPEASEKCSMPFTKARKVVEAAPERCSVAAERYSDMAACGRRTFGIESRPVSCRQAKQDAGSLAAARAWTTTGHFRQDVSLSASPRRWSLKIGEYSILSFNSHLNNDISFKKSVLR
jgi:hypothetical protein